MGSTARYRRIDHFQPFIGGDGDHLAGRGDVDGRGVDQQRPVSDRFEDLVVLDIDRAHVLAGRQHGNHHLGARHRRGGAISRRRPGRNRPFDRLRRDIERRDAMARLD
jgi:hypothetical protein